MNFSSPAKVSQIIAATDVVEMERSTNRDKIGRGINGFPPLSAEKARQMGLKVNISWLEETVLFKQACLQGTTAFQSRNNYFTVDVPSMPAEKRADWSLQLTQFINKPLKASREYDALQDEEWASVVAHGISPKIWLSKDKWLSDYIALNDFRVPTDTTTSLKNLSWFSVRRRYTIGELVQAVFGKYADEGWDKKAIIQILAAYWEKNWETSAPDDLVNNPEKFTALIKQNMGFYQSDAVPVITLWHFYHLDDENPLTSHWLTKVVPDKSCLGISADYDKFLFESCDPVAKKLDHLIHVQFGDLNGTPPNLFHSIRSLGFLLHESCFWMNLFRCRLFQHTWESFNLLWRSADGSNKARAQFLELFHKGYVPNEVTIIPNEQKNTIDIGEVEFVMGQAKQLMGEASASYTQDIDTGTKREQTLGEAQIKLQQSNAMMTGILTVAARNKVFEYREISRRFCIKKSLNPDVREFRAKCKRAGIPFQYLDSDLWEIACDMPLGSGNQTLELAQATQLMQVRTAHSPDAQQEILHIYDAAVTKNPQLAQRLAPVGGDKGISTGQMWAASVFGSLMQGTQVPMNTQMSPIDQIKTLLGMTAGVIQKITKTDNMGTPDDLAGLSAVMQYIGQLIQFLSQDPEQKQLVKQFSDASGKLQNIVKSFAQRQAEKAGAGKGLDMKEFINVAFKDLNADTKNAVLQMMGLPPSQMPEIDPKVLKAEQGMKIKAAQFSQKQRQNQIDFELKQIRLLTEHQETLSQETQAQNQKLVHAHLDKLQELQLAAQQPETSGESSA